MYSSPFRSSPICLIVSPSIRTSALQVRSAVTTVPPLMTLVMIVSLSFECRVRVVALLFAGTPGPSTWTPAPYPLPHGMISATAQTCWPDGVRDRLGRGGVPCGHHRLAAVLVDDERRAPSASCHEDVVADAAYAAVRPADRRSRSPDLPRQAASVRAARRGRDQASSLHDLRRLDHRMHQHVGPGGGPVLA